MSDAESHIARNYHLEQCAEIERLRAENDRLQRHAKSMIDEMNAENERLRAENEHLSAAITGSQNKIDQLSNEVHWLRAANAAMLAALQFYADEETWQWYECIGSKADGDYGRTARAAIKAAEGEG